MSAIGFTKEKCDTTSAKGLIIDIGDKSRTTNSQQPARHLKNTESDCHYCHLAEVKVFTPGWREEGSKEEVGG